MAVAKLKTPNVFICYGREDAQPARRLFADLSKSGCRPWLDTESLVPGQLWQPAIVQAIRACDYFIVLLSSRSVKRKGFLNREIQEALDVLAELPENHPFLIPARLDECAPAHQRLSAIQRVDMFPSWDDGLRQIKKTLQITSATGRAVTHVTTAFVLLTIDGAVELDSMRKALEAVPHVQGVRLLFGRNDFLVVVEGHAGDVSDSVDTIATLAGVGSSSAYLAAD